MTRLVRAIDISNHNGPLAAETAACLRDAGWEHVVVRASLETAEKAIIAQQQLAECDRVGLTVAVYCWCYFNEDPATMVADTLRTYGAFTPLCYWLDAEETDPRWLGASPGMRALWLIKAIAEIEATGARAGIYSGKWWWDAYMPGVVLPEDVLWSAQYDDVPTLDAVAYGGMTLVGKQYAGSETGRACGLAVDTNVFDRAWLYEEAPVPEHTYNAETPADLQTLDWTCSVHTTAWCLRSLGFDVNTQSLRHAMYAAGLVTPQQGLLDGSGGNLARWIRNTYGVPVVEPYPASWEYIRNAAGRQPIALGGARWGPFGHWVAVRTLESEGLSLMNPAPGHDGIRDYLDEAGWHQRGEWAALVIGAPVEGEDMSRIAELEAENAVLSAALAECQSYSSAVGHDIILPTVREMEAERAKAAGKRRWMDWSQTWIERLTPHVVE